MQFKWAIIALGWGSGPWNKKRCRGVSEELKRETCKIGLSWARVRANKPIKQQKCTLRREADTRWHTSSSCPFWVKSLPKSTSLTPPSVVSRMLLPLTSRWIILLLCKCWRPFRLEDRGNKVRSVNHPHVIIRLSLVHIKTWWKYKLHVRTPTAVQEERHSLPPDIPPPAENKSTASCSLHVCIPPPPRH